MNSLPHILRLLVLIMLLEFCAWGVQPKLRPPNQRKAPGMYIFQTYTCKPRFFFFLEHACAHARVCYALMHAPRMQNGTYVLHLHFHLLACMRALYVYMHFARCELNLHAFQHLSIHNCKGMYVCASCMHLRMHMLFEYAHACDCMHARSQFMLALRAL